MMLCPAALVLITIILFIATLLWIRDRLLIHELAQALHRSQDALEEALKHRNKTKARLNRRSK